MQNWRASAERRIELLREVEKRRCRIDLTAWAEYALAPLGLSPARHHRLLLSKLQAVADGTIQRLMVCMPPGSAKSTYTSELFPPWFLSRHPGAAVIAASHTAELAERFGRRVRNRVIEHADVLGVGIRGDNAAAGRWETTAGGEYYAAGVGGSITGRRADLLLIDDPVASRQDADSETVRNRAWDWYRADAYTRLKPGGRVVVIMTRWHLDDLGGRLLAEAENGGDRWEVIRLPALAEENDPLGRAPGEALWPEWEDKDALLRRQATVGSRDWAALYQQRPMLQEGSLFKVEKIGIMDAVPAGGEAVRAWDLASTANGGDWTAGVKLIRYSDGRFVVADVVRLQGSPRSVEDAIVNTAAQDGLSVQIGLPQDPGQAGKSQVQYFVSKLAGHRVLVTPETGAKETRAAPVASQVEVGNVSLVQAPWNRAFLDELRDFPAGRWDDQVDALSRAFGMLLTAAPMNINRAAIERIRSFRH